MLANMHLFDDKYSSDAAGDGLNVCEIRQFFTAYVFVLFSIILISQFNSIHSILSMLSC